MALGKKINELTPLTDLEAADPARLLVVADPASGIASSATVAQIRSAFGAKTLLYKATGAEGSTLSPGGVAGKNILFIVRESGVIFPAVSSPDPAEYVWATPDISLGTPVSGVVGERFLIVYSEL